jgi:soluble lytic murein transglycosylase
MKPFLRSVALIGLLFCSAAHADDPATLLEQWQRLRDTDAPTPSFSEAYRFLVEHPGWPDEKILRIRAEAAALSSSPDPMTMRKFCSNPGPISGRGMYACLRAQAGDPDIRRTWLHKGWIQGDFNEAEERLILSEYGSQLGTNDHVARIDRLLYEKKATPAKRMLPLTPASRRLVFKTRIALTEKDRDAKRIMRSLSNAERNDIGILYIQASAALEAKKLDSLLSLVKNIPANAPYPEQWWPLRHTAIREAIANKHFAIALAILNKQGDLTGEAMAEALWLKGWITLEFSRDATSAYKDFRTLYTQVGTPVSRARAAYWAGRAASKNGNAEIARDWWIKAALNPTVFYGQMAHLALHPNQPLELPAQPEPSKSLKQAYENEEITQMLRHLASSGNAKLFDRFIQYIAATEEDPKRLAMLAKLAGELGGVAREVKVAKLALRKQTVLIESGWPRLELPQTLSIEPALAMAITRQESEFDPYARSGADARGLMQLLPATARHVADKNGLPYTDSSLDDPAQNIVLGTTYLGQIIRGWDGSYILGIASYNAGPGSVRRWITAMGNPPKNVPDAINWIESIPFGETRNYVMRVLENTQVYRTLDAPQEPIGLAKDLTR